MSPVFSVFLLQEGRPEPADSPALRRLISGALGLPEDAEEQRTDQQPLEERQVQQPQLSFLSGRKVLLWDALRARVVISAGGPSERVHAGSPHVWAGWKQPAQ